MKKFYSLWSIAIASVCFFSCQQSVNDIINQAQQCKIVRGHYFGGGGMYDSANFIYDNSGRLVKLTNQDGHWLFTYNGNNIATRKFIDTIYNELLFLDSVWYDASGNVTRLNSHDYSMWFGDTLHTSYIYSYQNSKLDEVTVVSTYRDWTGNMVHDSMAAMFSWDAAGNNISKMVYYDAWGAFDSIAYQYNTDPNYFKVAHPHFYLFDPMFQLHVGLEPHFAYFYSKNNVINSNIYGSWDNPIDYGLDSVNKVTSVDMGGFEYFKYDYSCP